MWKKLERCLNRSEMWFFYTTSSRGYQCIVTILIQRIPTLCGEVASSRSTAKSNAAKAALAWIYGMM